LGPLRQDSPPPASICKRFWSPTTLLEQVPFHAHAEEASAIRRRNDVWLKTYMDMYILRWGALWMCSLVLAVLAAGNGILFVIALVFNLLAFAGLVAMIWTYRRAAQAIAERSH
jgi:hypothetical protein